VVSKAADNAFRQITSYSKPIKTPDDLKSYRIRVPVSAIFVSLFRALGASPTSINFNELYSSLQTHVVDGQENGLVTIEAGKLYEVQKYVAETNHIWDPFWLVANRRIFAALPPISFPGRPERWWGDEALKAEADAPQATLEQRHQATGHVLTLHRRGFFSAGALFSRASHSPVETAQ
jgi:TRAP-type transport system periplasmic protein